MLQIVLAIIERSMYPLTLTLSHSGERGFLLKIISRKVEVMWKELLKIAPDLIPIIIQTVIDVEKVVTGLKRGEVRKSRVMSIVGNILDTKDYFIGRTPEGQLQFLNLVSMFIDTIVSTFNYTGLFGSSEKLDFTQIPVNKEGQNEGD
jgi:hypothetical protein